MSGPYTSDDDRLVEALRQLQNLNPPLDFWKELTEVQRNLGAAQKLADFLAKNREAMAKE